MSRKKASYYINSNGKIKRFTKHKQEVLRHKLFVKMMQTEPGSLERMELANILLPIDGEVKLTKEVLEASRNIWNSFDY